MLLARARVLISRHNLYFILQRTTMSAKVQRFQKQPVKAIPKVASVVQPIQQAKPEDAQRHFSARRFTEAPISEQSKAGIKHEFMTDVQEATIDIALTGADLLVQAKTGTGKTVAFLLPTIERLQNLPVRPSQNEISVLVLSPTRELACQIEEEAKPMLQYHKPLAVQHAIGGTNIKSEISRITRDRCDILVATPGRLLDLLENYNLSQMLSKVKTVIFDEADRLLDDGFRHELSKIMGFLPNRTVSPRQVMMYSATISEDIKQIAASALLPDRKFVSTLLEDEVNTHEHVSQSAVIAPFQYHLPATLSILREDQAMHPGTSKVMVFFPTARATGVAVEVLSQIRNLPQVLEIHSRKSQPQRTKAANNFKDAKSAILLSSDVAARGMDFPGVTLVLQVGLPANAEQYIHRLGRTARAGAAGRGIIVLSSLEQFFLSLHEIRELPIEKQVIPDTQLLPAKSEISAALDLVSDEPKSQAYQAWLGYYKGFQKKFRMNQAQMVEEANRYAFETLRYRGDGVKPPPLLAKTVGKMGLKGVPGLNIVKVLPGQVEAGGRAGAPRSSHGSRHIRNAKAEVAIR